MKYHIDKNGRPALCKAVKRPCPLGEHFDAENEAQAYVDEQHEGEFGVLPANSSEKKELTPFEYELAIMNGLTRLRQQRNGDNYASKCRSCKKIDNLDKNYGDTVHMNQDRTARERRIVDLYGEGELVGTYEVDHQMGPAKRYRKQIAVLYDNGRLEIFDYYDKRRVTTFMAHGTRAEAMVLLSGELRDEEMYAKMTENHNAEAANESRRLR